MAKELEFTELDSSNIEGVAYEDGKLFIRFKRTSDVYSYDAPESEFQALLAAESAGKYFAKYIKGQFDFEKV